MNEYFVVASELQDWVLHEILWCEFTEVSLKEHIQMFETFRPFVIKI